MCKELFARGLQRYFTCYLRNRCSQNKLRGKRNELRGSRNALLGVLLVSRRTKILVNSFSSAIRCNGRVLYLAVPRSSTYADMIRRFLVNQTPFPFSPIFNRMGRMVVYHSRILLHSSLLLLSFSKESNNRQGKSPHIGVQLWVRGGTHMYCTIAPLDGSCNACALHHPLLTNCHTLNMCRSL